MTVRFCILSTLLSSALFAAESQYPKPPNQGGIYVIAHRGAHRGIPENTLAAYQKAIQIGADFVEIDLRTTKDGEFISIHNRTIDAYLVDGTQGEVSEFTLAQIKQLDIGSRIGPEWKDERVPTLDEILGLCRDQIGVYLDLKDGPVQAIAERIIAHGMQRQVVWCIDPDQVAAVKKVCPDCIPMPDPESEKSLPSMLKQSAPQVVAPVWSDFSSTFAAKCHQAGALVFVDEQGPDPVNWQLALDWEADGIQTDAPRELIEFLTRREALRNSSKRER